MSCPRDTQWELELASWAIVADPSTPTALFAARGTSAPLPCAGRVSAAVNPDGRGLGAVTTLDAAQCRIRALPRLLSIASGVAYGLAVIPLAIILIVSIAALADAKRVVSS